MKNKKMTGRTFQEYFLIPTMLIVAALGGGYAIHLYRSKFCQPENCSNLSDKIEQWGQTGDYFGGILNPFFTFIGLIFVIVTIQQNQKALKLNEKELEKTTIALQSQSKTAETQRFENTFFQLLSMINEIVQNSEIKDDYKQQYKGKSCFIFLCKWLKGNIHMHNLKGDQIKEQYIGIYQIHEHMLKGYFETLYILIIFIDSCKIKDIEKQFYNNLIRAHLSREELYLIYCNTVSRKEFMEKGFEEIEEIMHKYKYWDYLDSSELIDSQVIM